MELKLQPIRMNGKFAKGHIPHNYGKKAYQYLTEESYQKIISNLKRTGRKDIGGINKRAVLVFDYYTKEKLYFFESCREAAKFFNICPSNICKICRGKRHKIKNLTFKYFDDEN